MSILKEIVENKKKEVEFQKTESSLLELQNAVADLNPVQSLNNTLKLKLIAEIKQKSPSKGLIYGSFKPLELADKFEQAGASALSVLTDTKYFGGSIEVFRNVRQNTRLPLLRKDFIVDFYQVWQTRVMGADIILLIVKSLGADLLEYLKLSLRVGLQVLIETHSNEEVDMVCEVLRHIEKTDYDKVFVGINSRDLNTFEVDLDNMIQIKNNLPQEVQSVAESGVLSVEDLQKVSDAKFDFTLIGEGLSKNSDLLGFFKT